MRYIHRKIGQRAVVATHDRQDFQGHDQPVAGGRFVEAQNVPGTFSAQIASALAQHVHDLPVADFCPTEVDSLFLQGTFKRHAADFGSHYRPA